MTILSHNNIIREDIVKNKMPWDHLGLVVLVINILSKQPPHVTYTTTSLREIISSRGWASSTLTCTSSPICVPRDTQAVAWSPTYSIKCSTCKSLLSNITGEKRTTMCKEWKWQQLRVSYYMERQRNKEWILKECTNVQLINMINHHGIKTTWESKEFTAFGSSLFFCSFFSFFGWRMRDWGRRTESG